MVQTRIIYYLYLNLSKNSSLSKLEKWLICGPPILYKVEIGLKIFSLYRPLSFIKTYKCRCYSIGLCDIPWWIVNVTKHQTLHRFIIILIYALQLVRVSALVPQLWFWWGGGCITICFCKFTIVTIFFFFNNYNTN